MSVRPNIFYVVSELPKFADNSAECHYLAIKRVVRYLRQEPEKGIIWWRKEPKMTLPVGIIIPNVEMEYQLPGEMNPCESVT